MPKLRELKIVVSGNASKGELLMVLKGQPFPERYVPSIVENYTQYVTFNNVNYKIHVWQTVSEDKDDRLRPLSYSDANAVLLVCDLTSRTTFSNLSDKWLKEIDEYCPDGKIILIGINLDLRESGNPDHVTDQEAEQFVKENKCATYIPCSARTGEGIDKIFPAAITAFESKKESCIIC